MWDMAVSTKAHFWASGGVTVLGDGVGSGQTDRRFETSMVGIMVAARYSINNGEWSNWIPRRAARAPFPFLRAALAPARAPLRAFCVCRGALRVAATNASVWTSHLPRQTSMLCS